MIEILKLAFEFMSVKEKAKFSGLVVARALTGIIDLIGILLVGILAASLGQNYVEGQSNSFYVFSYQVPLVTKDMISTFLILTLIIFIFKAILSLFLTAVLAKHLATIEARSAKSISENTFRNGLEHLAFKSREEILFAIQTGSYAAFNSVLNSISNVLTEGFLFVLLFGSFMLVNPTITLSLFGFLALIAFMIYYVLGKSIQSTSEKMAQNSIAVNTALDDLFNCFREIAVQNKIEFFVNKVYKARLKSATGQARITYLMSAPRYIIETALIAGILGLVIIQNLISDSSVGLGSVGIFLAGGLRIMAAMLPFQAAITNIKALRAPALIALKILTLDKETDKKKPKFESHKIPKVQKKGIILDSVYFQYEKSSSPIVKNISLEIGAGSQVSIIGPSGSGKSTLADLILGLIKPTSGSISINGVSPDLLLSQKKLAYVPQKTGVVNGNIAQNIALGVEINQINHQKLLHAAEMANLNTFIDSLPEKFNTDLGKHSEKISGGQLQRIGLARAFYSDPDIIVMDEATSGLDVITEAEIGVTLESLKGKITVIIIAHKLNTVKQSDWVFVLEKGEITAQGKFEDVMEMNPRVAKAAKLTMTTDGQ